jgi:hypothetical protein
MEEQIDHSNEDWNNKRRALIQSEWKYLKSKLVEVGFVKIRTDHGIEIFEGNSDSYIDLVGHFDNIVKIKDQTHLPYGTSKIIVQKGTNTYTAWCA